MYQFLTMFKSFDRKKVMMKLEDLIRIGYGTYIELTSYTIQEVTDIFKVIESKKQEQELAKHGLV